MSELELRREARKAECRKLVEAAMRNMIEQLHSEGFSQAAVALALADAAEEYVIELAAKAVRVKATTMLGRHGRRKRQSGLS